MERIINDMQSYQSYSTNREARDYGLMLYNNAYVQYFSSCYNGRNEGGDIVPLVDENLEMYVLQRQRRGDGALKGDIILLSDIWQSVQLTPAFGAMANPSLTERNSLNLPRRWYLNSFMDKQVYQTVH